MWERFILRIVTRSPGFVERLRVLVNPIEIP